MVVVIESGVTTRAQLRRVTALLQRLNLSAVAFVLNRVSLAKADTAFRNSVQEIEKHLRTQGRPADWRAIRSRYFTSDLVGAGAEASIPADSAAVNQQGSADETGRSAEAEGAELSEFAAPLPDVQREIHQPTWQPDDIPWWLSDALARFEAAHSTPVAQPLHAPDKEIPIPAEAESQEESISAELLPIVEEETPHEIEAHSNGTAGMLFTVVRDELNQSAHPTSHAGNAAAAPEEPANGNKSRLSSLRGIVSPKNLKELEQARHSTDYVSQAAPMVDRAAPQTVRQDPLHSDSSRLSRLRGFVSTANLREFGQPKRPTPINGDSAPANHAAPANGFPPGPEFEKHAPPVQTQVSYARPDSSLTGPEHGASRASQCASGFASGSGTPSCASRRLHAT